MFRRTLRNAAGDLNDLKEIHARVSSYVAAKAKAAAPHRTGRLAGSGRGNRAAGRAEVRFGGASVPYANPIHWGWPRRHIAPNPFAYDTAIVTEPEWINVYTEGLDRILGQVKGV